MPRWIYFLNANDKRQRISDCDIFLNLSMPYNHNDND